MPRGKSNDPLVNSKRRYIWKHNAMAGHCAMMHSQLTNIINATSTTAETKDLAFKIRRQVLALRKALKTRVD